MRRCIDQRREGLGHWQREPVENLVRQRPRSMERRDAIRVRRGFVA
jgi:hypothetical protein